jgi:RNA 2',3'-cyclic 3'-phosphodiesterase
MANEMWRLFWAIEIPESNKKEIADIIQKLEKYDEMSVKWVDSLGIHITIKFLGDTEPDFVNDMTKQIRKTVSGIKPFTFKLEGFGCFPRIKDPKVIWIGVKDSIDQFQSLAKSIDGVSAKFGFAPENKKFTPHLTIGRVKMRLKKPDLTDQLQKLTYSSSTITANEIILMRSHLLPQGAKYEPVTKILL